MADKGSAAKRNRQNEKRRMHNKIAVSRVKTEIKKYREIIKKANKEDAENQLKLVVKLIDSAAGKGLYHKNNAARKKSRLAKALLKV